jgi:SOS response regulatory protein OraA/RecX
MENLSREELENKGLDQTTIEEILQRIGPKDDSAAVNRKIQEIKKQELEGKIKSEKDWRRKASLVAKKISMDLDNY